MRQYDAWMFPDGEQHLPTQLAQSARVEGRLTYQYPIYAEAVRHCPQRRTAVDVGAHVGLWSYWMVRDFAQVMAYEPVEGHRACYRINVPFREQDGLFPYALGAQPGSVRLRPHRTDTTTSMRIVGPGRTPLRTLDAQSLTDVDLVKIDCEGFEWEVLLGATTLLQTWRPIVVVEQRARLLQVRPGHRSEEAVHWLTARGAVLLWTDRRDFVLGWS